MLNYSATEYGGMLDWNVRNRNNQVVASGVYFIQGQNWHIDLRSGQSYEPVRTGAITGPLLAFLEAGGHIVAVTRDSDFTLKFSLLDPETLAVTRQPEPRPGAPEGLRVSVRTSTSIGVEWTPSAAVEHVLEIRPEGTARWMERLSFPQPAGSHLFAGLPPG